MMDRVEKWMVAILAVLAIAAMGLFITMAAEQMPAWAGLVVLFSLLSQMLPIICWYTHANDSAHWHKRYSELIESMTKYTKNQEELLKYHQQKIEDLNLQVKVYEAVERKIKKK